MVGHLVDAIVGNQAELNIGRLRSFGVDIVQADAVANDRSQIARALDGRRPDRGELDEQGIWLFGLQCSDHVRLGAAVGYRQPTAGVGDEGAFDGGVVAEVLIRDEDAEGDCGWTT